MRLFLQVDISDWQKRGYDQSLTQFASSLASDIVSTDLDNQSESTVVDLVLKLADQSEAVFLWINAVSDQPPGHCLRLFHHLLTHPHKVCQVVLVGSHAIVEKLILPWQGKTGYVNDIESGKTILQGFAVPKV